MKPILLGGGILLWSARRLLALSVLLASTPCAAADLDLFSAETLSLSGNVRLSATSGEDQKSPRVSCTQTGWPVAASTQ